MSEFKWGAWYPIDQLDTFLEGRPSRVFSIWSPSRKMSFQVSRLGANTISRLGLRPDEDHFEYWDATHFMPLPPSPEEMEAKPSLERLARQRIQKIVEAYNGHAERSTCQALMELLKEAGLE